MYIYIYIDIYTYYSIYTYTHIHICIYDFISMYDYVRICEYICLLMNLGMSRNVIAQTPQNTLPPLPRWAFPCTPMPVVRAMPPATALLAFHIII